MSNSIWFQKNQCTINQGKIKEFYAVVLKDFLEKLYKETRYKSNTGLDQQKIQQLGKEINNFLKQPAHLFNRCVNMKEGSSRFEGQIKDEIPAEKLLPQLKIEHQDENDNYFLNHKVNDKNEQRQEEEYQDDLAEFEGQELPKKHEEKKKSQVQVKKEDNFSQYIPKSEVKIEQGDSESQIDQNELTLQQCEQSLNCIVLGTFNANTLKHKPKQQKTSIEMDNVFIKWPLGQTFYGSLSMETFKMEKQQIREHFPQKRRHYDN